MSSKRPPTKQTRQPSTSALVGGEQARPLVHKALAVRRGSASATLPPYALGVRTFAGTPAKEVPGLLDFVESQLVDLYAPAKTRAYLKGAATILSSLLGTVVGRRKAPTNQQTNKSMKQHIKSATEAFGLLLTALFAAYVSVRGSTATPAAEIPDKEEEEEEEATETPAEKKARLKAEKEAKAAAKAKAEEDALLGGEEEEEEEEEEVTVTMDMLRAAGQAAIKNGKADKMKAILKKAGSENLGGLKESDYATVHAALSKLA